MNSKQASRALVLHGDHRSGNCYKAALMLRLAGRAFSWREVDVLRRESRTEAFLGLNPNGRVPVLQWPDGFCLAESNAMLLHLAEGTAYLPGPARERAQVYQWLFFEQYSHEPYIAVARFLRHFDHGLKVPQERFDELESKGRAALAVMERHLEGRDFFVGEAYSIADIALYAYTHTAGDGGFELDAYPRIGHWMACVRRQPGHFDLDGLAGLAG